MLSNPRPTKQNKTTAFGEAKPAPTVDLDQAEAMPTASVKMTDEIPPLPFACQYKHGESFYVRKCYQDYYKHVKAMLDAGKRCVTVTGTPGIGKSTFYAYFFKHYLEEIKDTYIIAILSVDRTIEEAAVFDDHGNKIKDLVVHPSTILADIDAAAVETLEAKKKVFFLCDGAPTRRWRAGQMVVCTSPNVKWLKMVRKDLCTLYMPLWTLEELHEAAFALRNTGIGFHGGDGTTDDQIEARFNLFGGVARECFLPTQLLVDSKKRDLITEIDRVSNLKDLEKLVYGVSKWSECYRVLHSVPCLGGISSASQFASAFVVERLSQRLLKSVGGDGQKLIKSLEYISKTEPLREWIFRTGIHHVLQQGGVVVDAQQLQDSDSSSGDQVSEVFRIGKTSPYRTMELPTKAIDGFYLLAITSDSAVTAQDVVNWNATHRLILFRTTISETLSVDASEITLVLEKLGLLEAVKANPKRVALVFVAPEAIARNYSRQKVDPEATDDTSVASFNGVGPVAAAILVASGISTVGQLKAAISAKSLPDKVIRGHVLASLCSMRDKSYSEAIAKIPQYVWPLSKEDISFHFKKMETWLSSMDAGL